MHESPVTHNGQTDIVYQSSIPQFGGHSDHQIGIPGAGGRQAARVGDSQIVHLEAGLVQAVPVALFQGPIILFAAFNIGSFER